MRVFLDAGGWLSVVNRADQHHAAGRAHFETLIDLAASLETSDYVLDEVITRLRYDIGHRAAVDFLDLINASVAAGPLTIRIISPEIRARAEAIFRRYGDARLSFTDCTSFALLSNDPPDEVFGFDAHFEMMGFLLQPK